MTENIYTMDDLLSMRKLDLRQVLLISEALKMIPTDEESDEYDASQE